MISLKNKKTLLICFCALTISITPLLIYKKTSATGDIISPARKSACREQGASSLDCYESGPMMNYYDVSQAGIDERVVFKHLFSHLDKINYFSDDFFFLPIFSYILIFISLITVFDRLRLLLSITGIVILLISLCDTTPIHRMLFDHIFYFE